MTRTTKMVVGLALLAAIVTLGAIHVGRAQSGNRDAMRMIFAGQSLNDVDIRAYRRDSFDEMKQAFRGADVTFTNLEAPIRTSQSVPLVKQGITAHGAAPAVLDALKDLGFNLLSLSNNHVWDVGERGVLDTLTEVDKRKFVHAGTGRQLDEATAPAYLETPAGRVALVAMASGGLMPDARQPRASQA